MNVSLQTAIKIRVRNEVKLNYRQNSDITIQTCKSRLGVYVAKTCTDIELIPANT